MKLFVVAALLVVAASAAPFDYASPAAPFDYVPPSYTAPLITITPDGSIRWNYTESNYTALEESQNQKYQATSSDSYGSNTNRGSYFSISPEGEKIMLPWTADKNGFQASG
ncbi:endocuticle structural glycoprotein SgAbd-1 [Daphnia magna]|uniref:endocuticle structural glycoprotein SgAbd-1 n=1 Tax=Daphnia magna TaxID=35525 RepID=UPI001E1BD3B9|nr:endocuticle structural glycoprotein SgAbd-1 [Daphnia magna]